MSHRKPNGLQLLHRSTAAGLCRRRGTSVVTRSPIPDFGGAVNLKGMLDGAGGSRRALTAGLQPIPPFLAGVNPSTGSGERSPHAAEPRASHAAALRNRQPLRLHTSLDISLARARVSKRAFSARARRSYL